MPTMPMIKKMPLNSIKVSKGNKDWLKTYMADIIERGAVGGDLHSMLMEAYVLGFHHCLTAYEAKNHDNT